MKIKAKYDTKDLSLVILNSDSTEEILNFYCRNKEFLDPWEPKKAPRFFTKDYQKASLMYDYQQALEGDSFRFWIIKKKDQSIIGAVSLTNIIRGAFKSCFLGYKIDKNETGKGYMTEAVERVIEIAFTDLQLHRLEAHVMPSNAPSLRVMEKLNFKKEGYGEKYLKINGRWEDHLHFALINENNDIQGGFS